MLLRYGELHKEEKKSPPFAQTKVAKGRAPSLVYAAVIGEVAPSDRSHHLRLLRGRMEGQREKMEVERPPRGVNSPRTTHHSGRTAATMSRRILLTAFS